jgi:hypothetical protein
VALAVVSMTGRVPLRTGYRETSPADSQVAASGQIECSVLLSPGFDLPGPERFGTVLPLQQRPLAGAVNGVAG